jgi:hypothetical protein
MKLRFAGVRRKTEFSPNLVENDLYIINRIADHLKGFGAEVNLIDEARLTPNAIKEELIFSMAQGPMGIRVLNNIARKKSPLIINSPDSVLGCYRFNLVKRLPGGGIPFPKSIALDTSAADASEVEEMTTRKIWVKRGDVHATYEEDVVSVYNLNEVMTILREFEIRAIKTVVLQENVEGEAVKFYAVRDVEFFRWYYINDTYHAPFDQKELQRLADCSAEILGLWIYGGDAIIGPDGSITIIDIEDWPSFAPVREEASAAIANLLYTKAREFCRV